MWYVICYEIQLLCDMSPYCCPVSIFGPKLTLGQYADGDHAKVSHLRRIQESPVSMRDVTLLETAMTVLNIMPWLAAVETNQLASRAVIIS